MKKIADEATEAAGTQQSRRDAFIQFHEAHPEVYDKLVASAHGMKALGFERYSMRTIWEIMRWHYDVHGPRDGSGFKLNDHYPPFYSRLIMHREPELRGFFDTRG